MYSTPIRRSARIQGEPVQSNGLDEKTIKEIRREAIAARRKARRVQLEKENVEMEQERAEYESKLNVWKQSMSEYYQQRNAELEQKKAERANLRNPIAFHADQWGYDFLDKGGVVEQYRTQCLIVGKTYYRIIVDALTEEHPGVTCDETMEDDVETVYAGSFRFHLNDLPKEALDLPWMKSWEENNEKHYACCGKTFYTVREIVRFTHTLSQPEQEAQSQW